MASLASSCTRSLYPDRRSCRITTRIHRRRKAGGEAAQRERWLRRLREDRYVGIDRADFGRQAHARVDHHARAARQLVEHRPDISIWQVHIEDGAVGGVSSDEIERLSYGRRRAYR